MIEEIAEYIRTKIQDISLDTGLILGSGLGKIADLIQNPIIIPYKNIPHFPQSTVNGHKGQLVIGQLQKHNVICFQGRFHLYEGLDPQIINTIIQSLKVLGIKQLIITNASGSLNYDIAPGSIMLITDHINLSGKNPLIGYDDEKYGPRFPSMMNCYTPDLREKIKKIASQENITLHEGVYMMVLGPNFETPAEIKAFRILGADVVGMSTLPEVISASRCGMGVIGLSVITNYGAGMVQGQLSHAETLRQSEKACSNLCLLIENFLKD